MISEGERADLRRFIAAVYGFGRNPSRRQSAQIDHCFDAMLTVYWEHERQNRFEKGIAKAAQQMNLGARADLRAPAL
jgi:hypothetical protein